jgi:sulfatase maturation enzyme AslB (radical SAM superfamily)
MTQGPTPFTVLAQPNGPLCNLDCKYCFYVEKERLYPGSATKSNWAMSEAVLDVYIRQYIESQLAPAECPGNAPARLTAQHRQHLHSIDP